MRRLIPLLLLTVTSPLAAAPAPAPKDRQGDKLEALKNRLPAVFKAWEKAHHAWGDDTHVVLAASGNAAGNGWAKLRYQLHERTDGEPAAMKFTLEIVLKYEAGRWSTTRWKEGENPYTYSNNLRHWEAFNRLLDAIDEAAKKR
jgi:hypothetical protein